MTTTTEFQPTKTCVLVTELERGMTKTAAGLLLPEDNMKLEGIRPRWGKVYKIGPDVTGLKPGDWLLLAHGRWTNRIKLNDCGEDVIVWRIEYPDAVLLVSEIDPRDRREVAAPHISGYGLGD
jgi:hypothetical protein